MSTPGSRSIAIASIHLKRVQRELRSLEKLSFKQKLSEAQIGALQEASMSLVLAADTLKAVSAAYQRFQG